MTTAALTAAQAGLVSCETCSLLSRPVDLAKPGYCPRCGGELAMRHHNSIQYTWALVIAAAICYIPANMLPVLNTSALGKSEPDTIISGVIFLYTSGSWPLALIVLVASVMVPLGKLIALVYLLITVQRRSIRSNRERTRLYRMVEFIGRWSMLDVFVDTFTVALVQLQPLMSVAAGAGRALLRGGRRPDHARRRVVRPPSHLGLEQHHERSPWLTTPTHSAIPAGHRRAAAPQPDLGGLDHSDPRRGGGHRYRRAAHPERGADHHDRPPARARVSRRARRSSSTRT